MFQEILGLVNLVQPHPTQTYSRHNIPFAPLEGRVSLGRDAVIGVGGNPERPLQIVAHADLGGQDEGRAVIALPPSLIQALVQGLAQRQLTCLDLGSLAVEIATYRLNDLRGIDVVLLQGVEHHEGAVVVLAEGRYCLVGQAVKVRLTLVVVFGLLLGAR